jgi:cytoskeletal protein RodZ
MRSKVGWGRAAAGLGLLVIAGWLVWAQYTPGTRIQAPSQPGFGDGPNVDPLSETKRMKALNTDRHKTMVSDTEKLVKLARQLDAEIASNPTDAFTPEEAQKLAAIEKLAHNVKTKMAQSFGGGPEFTSPIIDTRVPGAK